MVVPWFDVTGPSIEPEPFSTVAGLLTFTDEIIEPLIVSVPPVTDVPSTPV